MLFTKGIQNNFLFLLIILVSPTVFSANKSAYTNSPVKFVATLSAGPVWESGGKTQTFYLAPEVQKTYAANHSTQSLGNGELFLGIQKPLNNKFQTQLGIAVATAGSASMSGNIWDDADPQFNNYTYKYRIKHTHMALKCKLLYDNWPVLTPWISGSIGIGLNRAYGFNNTSTTFEAVQNPNFSSHNKTAFTYTLGVGIQKILTKNWQIGIGYEFADWGKSQLGSAPGQTMGNGLSLDHLYTNGVLLNITWVS